MNKDLTFTYKNCVFHEWAGEDIHLKLESSFSGYLNTRSAISDNITHCWKFQDDSSGFVAKQTRFHREIKINDIYLSI